MRRCLLVLDRELLDVDEQLGLAPISWLRDRSTEQPYEVVVLSLVDRSPGRMRSWELLLGARIGKFPRAPRAGYDVHAAARHRGNRAAGQLRTLGCRATGVISDQPLVAAVRAELAARDVDDVVLATGPPTGRGVAALLRLDPVHRLRRRLGTRLVTFPVGTVGGG